MLRVLCVLALSVLVGCSASQPKPQPVVEAEKPEVDPSVQLLDQAFDAIQNNHLLLPREGSAVTLYRQVLALQPDNAEAKRGLLIVASKYQSMAEKAIAKGHYFVAADYLVKADGVVLDHPKTLELGAQLASAQSAKANNDAIALDLAQLKQQAPEMVQQLRNIAAQIEELDTPAVIYAPTDRIGRWIYQQLNEHSLNYRVRGDLRISAAPRIELIKPAS